MSVTVDSLDIQIRSSAGSATKNIEELAKALGRLNSNAKMTKITNSLTRLNDALTHMRSNSSVIGQLSSLSQHLAKLGTIPKLTGLQSAIRELKKLPAVMKDLNNSDFTQFVTRIRALSNALTPLATKLDRIGTAFSKLPARVSQVVTATNRMTKATVAHGDALNHQSINLLAAYENLQNYLSILHFVGDAFAAVMADAIEWDGIQFRFGRAFGEDAEMVLDYAEKVSEELRINQQQFMQYSSLYASLLSGFGMAQKEVTTISVGLTELSYDIWAAYNDRYKTLEAASEAVRSAITGEIEPIRNAGIALTEASMQEYLDSIGMATTSIEKLTEAQKSEVRYAVMVNSALNQGIVGTYAREMDTAEGVVRTFTQQLKTLGQAIGSLFLPVLVAVVPWLTAFVELLTEGIAALAGFFGIDFKEIKWGDPAGMKQTADDAEATAGALGDAAKSAKAMRDYTMGFDELNIIDPSSAAGAAGGAGGAGAAGGGSLGLDLDTLWDDAVFKSASKQIDELKAKIKEYVDEHKTMLTVVGTVAGFLGFMKILRGLNSLLGITKTIANLATAFGVLKKAASSLKTAAGTVKTFFQLLKEGAGLGGTLAATFPKAADILTKIGGAFKTAFTKLPSVLVNIVKAIPVWGWVVAAIAAMLTLAIVDYDFSDIGYKIGYAIGTALKKVGDFFRGVGDWIVDVGRSIRDGIASAIKWARDTLDTKGIIGLAGDIVNGLWEGIKNGWTNFWENVNELLDGFIQGVKDAFGIHSPSTVFAEIGGYVVEGLLNGIMTGWNTLVAWFNATIAPKFTKEFWAAKWENARKGTVEKLTAIKADIATKWDEVTTWFKQNVSSKLTAQYWRLLFDGIRQGVAQKMSDVKQSIVTKWDETKAWFTSNVSPKLTLSYWTKAFRGIGDGLKAAVKAGINKAVDLLNEFIDWANDALNIKFDGLLNPLTGKWIIKPMNIQLATIPKIPYFADGGFPDMGQMFIAREAGPELVGNINGRTAVANNDQIVAAVAQGVYEAVVSAMSGNYGSGNQSINVYLDSKQITAAVEKRQNERGMQLIGNQLGFA